MPPWADIDTVLLDMDGTLIDLHFDNHLWNVVVPERYAEREAGCKVGREKTARSRAIERLYRAMLASMATLDFYDLDYWTQQTGLDIDAIHAELKTRIRYRPGAPALAAAVRAAGKTVVLATNAHPRSIAVKHEATGLLDHLDACYSAHELGAPKENARYWHRLAERLNVNGAYRPAHTLLIDDNDVVLAAAQRAGIGHLLCVAQPDSTIAPRANPPCEPLCEIVYNFAEIMP